MNAIISKILTFLRENASKFETMDDAIQECASKGFTPVQVMIGLNLHYGVSDSKAKQIVANHPVWRDQRESWDALHDLLEREFSQPLPPEES